LLPCPQGITSRRFDLLQRRMRVTTGRTDQVERLAHFRCLTDASQSELPGDVGLDHGRHADDAEAQRQAARPAITLRSSVPSAKIDSA